MTDTNEVLFRILSNRKELNSITEQIGRLEAQVRTCNIKLEDDQKEILRTVSAGTQFVLEDPDDPKRCVIFTVCKNAAAETLLHTHQTYIYRKGQK